MNDYLELTVTTTHVGSELVSDILAGWTDLGVSVSDIEDVLDLERSGKAWDYADESIYTADKTVLVKGYFPIDNAAEIIKNIERELISLKANSPFDLGSLEVIKREIDGSLWREQWKEHFKPIHLGKVVIVPEWIPYAPKNDEKVVLIGSNMAFGTGEHETTSMCVEFIAKYVKADDTVIDVGCGSGILGITASKLGAKEVVMTDIDECAVTASEQNMALNGITNGKVLLKNLLDDTSIKCNLLVCNIMAEVLIAFAPHISGNLLDNSKIILSGILTDRLERVKEAYIEAGFTFIEQKVKGEWSALVLSWNNKR